MDSNIPYRIPTVLPPPSSPSLSSTAASFLTDSFNTATHDKNNVTDKTPRWNHLSSFEQFCGNSPFWDTDLLLNSPYPNFTPCFRQVGLAWIPCILYIVMVLPYILYLRKLSLVPFTQSAISISKMIFTICLLGVTIGTIVIRAVDGNQDAIPDALYVSEGLKAFCFILSIVVSQLECHKGQIISPLNWTFWLILLIASVVPFYSFLEEDTLNKDRFGFITFYIYFALIFNIFIINSFAELRKEKDLHLSQFNTSADSYMEHGTSSLLGVNTSPGKGSALTLTARHSDTSGSSEFPTPEPTASIPSRLSFWWMNSLVILGFKRTIEEDDIHDLVPEDKCETMMPDFLTSWKNETARVEQYNSKVVPPRTPVISHQKTSNEEEAKEHKKKTIKSPYKSVSLLRVLMSNHGLLLFCSLTAKAAFDSLRFLSPMMTEALIDFISNRDKYYQWRGYILALSYLVVNQIVSIGSNQAIFYTKRVAFRIKSSLINAIYRKSLTTSSMGNETSKGEVINLMSEDCQHIEDISNFLFNIFSVPLQVVLAFYLLYRQLGVAVFAGMGLMFAIIPVTAFVGHLDACWEENLMKHKDDRMSVLSEVLNGIKVLKLYAWEGSFQEKLEEIRAKELLILKKFFNVDAIMMFCILALPSLVQVASYGAYISDKGFLNPSVAFVSLQLFTMMNEPLGVLSFITPFFVKTLISINRISAYLNKPDIKPDVSRVDVHAENDIHIENGEFTWSVDRESSTLRNINLEIKPGSLVAVVGTVGCGKSSLLSAMLGEMERVSGTVTLKGNIAYVPQQAWIQNATVKDNITFGSAFHQNRYDKIIEACALTSDLAIFPGGDLTEIGEKGINISGGQKQRLSLARAVYSDRDIYLMDDPLSAVDSHVGKHIFEQVIGEDGVLKRKTRVLVTHGNQYLPRVDKVFVVSNGVISETGTYTELLEKDRDFGLFLKEYAQENSDKTEDKSVEEEDVFYDEHSATSPLMLSLESTEETSFSKRSNESKKTPLVTQRKLSKSHPVSSQDEEDSVLTRQNSKWDGSIYSIQSRNEKVGTRLIEDEMRLTGRVKFQNYFYYMMEIGAPACVFSLCLYLLYAATSVFSAVWLTLWSGDQYLLNETNKGTPEYSQKTRNYLSVYGGVSAVQGLFVLCIAFLVASGVIKASKTIHTNMLKNVLRCPMSFFDTTPIGRIQNRFSQDVQILDYQLPFSLRQVMSNFIILVITLINISYGTPIFLAALVPIALLFLALQAMYIPTIRQLRRINSVTRSPIYVHFSETLGGTSSIRAYECQERFITESMDKVDYNGKVYFSSVCAVSWLSFRLQFLSNLIVFAAAIFAVATTDIDPSVVGLSVSYASSTTETLEELVRFISETETCIVSVERMKEYTVTPQEAEWVLDHHRPNPSWPEEGNVIFDNYQTRYRPGLELVLKDVSCTIKGGEKVGIVGRTGAGKSSMTVGLFRIIESAGGRIVIDGEDVSQMGLHDLRNKITILPQDPVIFSGSMRMNLDPFSKYTEPEIWDALEHSYLKEFVEGLPERLEYECGEEGANLSVGQRQLVCLARTLLRKTKILVLDEATAAVDMETDDLIQQTIRREFSDCTILTIAHRLNTIMDYDKVMVLDKGCIKELDSPQALLADENSIFHAMAADAGM